MTIKIYNDTTYIYIKWQKLSHANKIAKRSIYKSDTCIYNIYIFICIYILYIWYIYIYYIYGIYIFIYIYIVKKEIKFISADISPNLFWNNLSLQSDVAFEN